MPASSGQAMAAELVAADTPHGRAVDLDAALVQGGLGEGALDRDGQVPRGGSDAPP
jgi:hypothetical protein